MKGEGFGETDRKAKGIAVLYATSSEVHDLHPPTPPACGPLRRLKLMTTVTQERRGLV